MKTISVKTSELTGAALRYAVAVAAGHEVKRAPGSGPLYGFFSGDKLIGQIGPDWVSFSWQPDRDWSQLGPLIDRFEMEIKPTGGISRGAWHSQCWRPAAPAYAEAYGPSPMIAACRAIAAAYHGDYADVPRELVEET